MDPLSITASVIAVLQATSAVLSICYDYSSAVKGSLWELPKLIDEVRDLRNVLETLEQLSRQSDDQEDSAAKRRLPSLQLLCVPETGLLARCLSELAVLEQKLKPPRWSGPAGSKRRALIQATAWPLKIEALEKTLSTIGRFKTTLSLALTADEANLMMAIEDTTREILVSTSDMRNDMGAIYQKIASKAEDELRLKVFDWLSAPDPSSNYTKARELCQNGTGLWFLRSKQFMNWKTAENSLLWLHGIPGCGKTVLTSTIVDHIINYTNNGVENGFGTTLKPAVLHFYFDFNDAEKQSHEKMIRSLILQIASQNNSLPSALQSLYLSCTHGQRQPTVNSLLETLQELIIQHGTQFLILDALDECSERQELLQSLELIASWRLRLHILCTSRREADIGEYLNSMATDKMSIQTTLVDTDIRAYVRERLQKDWRLKRWRKQLQIQVEIEHTLMEKAAGMFRWAVCQLDALGRCLTVPMLRKALQALPSTLNETYDRILYNIDESWSQPVACMLEWLVFSATPMKLTEVAELIAVDIEDDPPFNPDKRLPEPKEILLMCSSLITLTKEKAKEYPTPRIDYENIGHEYNDYEDITYDYHDEHENGADEDSGEDSKIIVRLAHFSVKEYLVSRKIQVGKTVHHNIVDISAHVSMAETCLVYLSQFDKADSLTLQTPLEFPLLRYAAKYWLYHARLAENSSNRLVSLIMDLFLSKREVYSNWIRVFDPERPSETLKIHNYAVETCSPLYYAALAGLLEPARLLIANGSDVNLSEGTLGCSFLAALQNQHEDLARLLVNSGAAIGVSAPDWPLGMTALHCAARDGYQDLANELIKRGAPVGVRTDAGLTSLHIAVENSQKNIAQLLLKYEASINARDNVGKTPLHGAVKNGDLGMTALLLDHGADIEAVDDLGMPALLIALKSGCLDVVQLLLAKQPKLNVRDINGQTPIHFAAVYGHVKIVEKMLDSMRKRDNYGQTALHLAAESGNDEIVQLLLSKGANIEVRTKSSKTPLYCAAMAGHASTVRILLDSGADIRARDQYGGSVLYAAAAARASASAVVDLLIENIEQQTRLGWKLLHYAAATGDLTMLELLIEQGVDLHARTSKGETALYLAITRDRHDAVRLLRDAKVPR